MLDLDNLHKYQENNRIEAKKAQGWQEPEIVESFGPDRTLLTLPLEAAGKKSAIKIGDKIRRYGGRQSCCRTQAEDP